MYGVVKEVFTEGELKGKLKGKLATLFELVKDNLLTEEIAIQKSGLSAEEYIAAKEKWLKFEDLEDE